MRSPSELSDTLTLPASLSISGLAVPSKEYAVKRVRTRHRPTLVLLHGAWHHGGHWAQVAKHLRRKGYQVHTPTVAGHGRRANKNVSHAQAIASIIDYLDARELTDFVLLGHDLAGTYLCKIAEEMPNRIRRLVFHNAYVLQSGNSVYDELPSSHQELIRQHSYGDTFLPPGKHSWHPRHSARLGIHRLVQTPGSHEVLHTAPRRLADKIIEAGRD